MKNFDTIFLYVFSITLSRALCSNYNFRSQPYMNESGAYFPNHFANENSTCVTPSILIPSVDQEKGACFDSNTVGDLTEGKYKDLKHGHISMSCSTKNQTLLFFLKTKPRFKSFLPWKVASTAAKRLIKKVEELGYERPLPPQCECIEDDNYNATAQQYHSETFVTGVFYRVSPIRRYKMEPQHTNCPIPAIALSVPEESCVYNQPQRLNECLFRLMLPDLPFITVTARTVEFDMAANYNGERRNITLDIPLQCRSQNPARDTILWIRRSASRPNFYLAYVSMQTQSEENKIVTFQNKKNSTDLIHYNGRIINRPQ